MTNAFLTAEWRKLIMAQYAVDPATLEPRLPAGVSLDLYQGRCYVSLVGFLFDRVRLKGLAIPFHTRFEEVNLRFYVVREEADGSRKRGVVFIREFVPKAAITEVARTVYEEPYTTLPMRHTIVSTPDTLTARYEWQHQGIWHFMAVDATTEQRPIAPGSEEEFVTEHYWGYTKRSRGNTSEYPVQHPRWSIYPIRKYAINANMGALYGCAFASVDAASPTSVLLAEGSAVTVFGGHRLSY